MTNPAKKIATLALAGFTLGNAEAKDIKDYTHGKLDDLKTEIKAKASKITDPQAYNATADFQKSREISEADPRLTQNEVQEIMKHGKEVVTKLGGLKGEKLLTKMETEKIKLEGLKELYDKLGDCYVWYGAWKSRAEEDKYRAEKGTRGISREVAGKEIEHSHNKEEEAKNLMNQVMAIITEVNKAQIERAKANGVVTDYTKIAENTKLAEMIKKMHITFEKDEDGVIEIYVNGENTNFKLFKPEKDFKYRLFSDSENNRLFIEKEKKKGYVFQIRFILKGNKVLIYYKRKKASDWKKTENDFELPSNENPAKKEVSMSH